MLVSLCVSLTICCRGSSFPFRCGHAPTACTHQAPGSLHMQQREAFIPCLTLPSLSRSPGAHCHNSCLSRRQRPIRRMRRQLPQPASLPNARPNRRRQRLLLKLQRGRCGTRGTVRHAPEPVWCASGSGGGGNDSDSQPPLPHRSATQPCRAPASKHAAVRKCNRSSGCGCVVGPGHARNPG